MYSIRHTVDQPLAQGASQQQRIPLPITPSILLGRQDDKLDRAIGILEEIRQKEEDECEIFAKLVASKLQRYSSELCTNVQKAIMDIMYKADRQTDLEVQFDPSPEPFGLPSRPENLNNNHQQLPYCGYLHLFPNLIHPQRAPQPSSSTPTSEQSPYHRQDNPRSPTNSNPSLNQTWEIRSYLEQMNS